MDTDLQALRDLVAGAALSADVRRKVLWGLDQLPPLYKDLDRTYNTRYRDKIVERVREMLKTLGGKEPGCPDAPTVSDSLLRGLMDMHRRVGLPTLGLKLPPPPKPKPARKKAT